MSTLEGIPGARIAPKELLEELLRILPSAHTSKA